MLWPTELLITQCCLFFVMTVVLLADTDSVTFIQPSVLRLLMCSAVCFYFEWCVILHVVVEILHHVIFVFVDSTSKHSKV